MKKMYGQKKIKKIAAFFAVCLCIFLSTACTSLSASRTSYDTQETAVFFKNVFEKSAFPPSVEKMRLIQKNADNNISTVITLYRNNVPYSAEITASAADSQIYNFVYTQGAEGNFSKELSTNDSKLLKAKNEKFAETMRQSFRFLVDSTWNFDKLFKEVSTNVPTEFKDMLIKHGVPENASFYSCVLDSQYGVSDVVFAFDPVEYNVLGYAATQSQLMSLCVYGDFRTEKTVRLPHKALTVNPASPEDGSYVYETNYIFDFDK